MSLAATEFLDVLEKSRIFSRKRLERTRSQVTALKSPPESNQALADLLVKSNVITKFQADAMLSGRHRSLRVGNYALLEPLGWGGMGTVYRAWDVESQQLVAVKILSERFRHEAGMRARFTLEGRAGQLLDHPQLLKSFEYGQIEDVYGETDYMIMELFEGVGLNELVEQIGKLPFGVGCHIALQAAEGLAALHERGLVHRDIKCENILVNKQGEVKVIDFGLALADQELYEDEFSLSMIFGHDCLGTVDYMPPEQMDDSLHVDQRADIYTLAGVLFGIIAARLPYPRKNRREVAEAHRRAPPPLLRQYAKDAPQELEDLLVRMFAKNPNDRPANIAEVITVLRKYATPGPVKFSYSKALQKRRRVAEQKGLESASVVSRLSTATARSTAIGKSDSTKLPVPASEPVVIDSIQSAITPELVPSTRSRIVIKKRTAAPQRRSIWPRIIIGLLFLASLSAATWWFFAR